MADNFDPYRSEQSIFSAIEGKTAALLRTSCRLGGRCAGLDEDQIDALGNYGHAFGMSFQLIDDVLDFVSSKALSGKPVLNDLRCGVYTLPVALARTGEHGDELLRALVPGHATGRPATSTGLGPSLSESQVEAVGAILRSGDYFRRVLDLAMSLRGRGGGAPDGPPRRPDRPWPGPPAARSTSRTRCGRSPTCTRSACRRRSMAADDRRCSSTRSTGRPT